MTKELSSPVNPHVDLHRWKNPVAESQGLSLRFEVGGDIAISYPKVRETEHFGSPRTEGAARKWNLQL